MLLSGVDKRLERIVLDTAKEYSAEVIEWEGMPDHVPLLIEVDPQDGIHRMVRQLKGRSSHSLRREVPSLATGLPTLWTHSYFVSPVGGSPPAAVKQYIESQKRSER